MQDTRSKIYQQFPVDSKGAVAWFNAGGVKIASIQAIARPAWSGSPVLECIVSNFMETSAAQLLSTILGSGTYEIDANGEMLVGIDVGGKGYQYLGVRVKTAGSSGDRADIMFFGNSDGTGKSENEPPDTARGL